MATTTEKLKAVVEVETRAAQAQLKALDKSIDDVSRNRDAEIDVDVDADMAGFHAELKAGLARAEATSKIDVDVDIDKDRHLADVNASLAAMLPAFQRVSGAAKHAQRSLKDTWEESHPSMVRARRQIRGAGDDFDGLSKSIFGAWKRIKLLKIGLGAIKFAIIAGAAKTFANILVGLGASVVAVTGSLSRLSAVLASLPSFLYAAGQAGGALISIFSGIGSALSGFAADQKAVGGGGGGIAETLEDTRRKIVDYGRSIEDAVERVYQAERAVALASEALKDAQERETRAQEKLNNSRAEAIEYLDDLKRSTRALANDEEDAQIRLAEAQRVLDSAKRDAGIPEKELREAKLAVADAEVRLAEVQDARQESVEELTEMESKGIDQSFIVKEAEEELAEAKQDTIDVMHEQMLAQREQDRATQDHLRLIADEAKLTGKAAAGGGGGVSAFADAMKDLGPNAQEFVKETIKVMEAFKEIKKNVQEIGIVGFTEMMVSVQGLMPILGESLETTAQHFSDLGSSLGEFFGTDAFKADFSTILGSNNVVIDNMNDAFMSLIEGLVDLAVAAAPFTEWLSSLVADGAAWLAETIKINRENGDLEAFFERAKGTMETFGSILSNLGTTFRNVFGEATGLGDNLLDTLERVTGEWADWTSIPENQNKIRDWFLELEEPINKTFGFLAALTESFTRLGSGDTSSPFLDKLTNDVLPSIETFLDNASNSGMLDSLMDAFVSFIDILSEMSDKGGVLTVFFDGMSTFFDVVKDILGIPGVSKTLGKIAAAFFAIKLALLGFKVTGLTTLATAIWALIGPAVLSGLGSLATAISGLGIALSTALFWVVIIAAVIAAIYLLWKNWDKVTAWLAKSWEWVKEKWGEMWEKIKEEFPRVVNWFKTLPGKILEALGSAWDWLKDKATELWDGFLHYLPIAAEVVWEWLKDLPDLILEKIGDASEWLGEKAAELILGFLDGILEEEETLTDWFVDLKDLILGKLTTIATWLGEKGKDLIKGLWTGVTIMWDEKGNIAGWIKDRIIDAFNLYVGVNQWILDKGEQLIKGLWSGLQIAWDEKGNIATWIKNHINDDFFVAANPNTWLKGVGKAIVEGLWNGFSSEWGGDGWGTVKKIQDKINNLPWIIKKILGIKSPSTVFAEIGKNMAEGLEKGFDAALNMRILEAFGVNVDLGKAQMEPDNSRGGQKSVVSNNNTNSRNININVNGYDKDPQDIVREAYWQDRVRG